MSEISLYDRLNRYSKQCVAYRLDPDFADAVDEAANLLLRRNGNGKWVTEVDGGVVCSECGNTAEINGITGEFMESPYCSECGAKMDGGI